MIRPAVEPRLPPLREEIALGPGPVARDGSPTWTLHDPQTGRFVRVGWMEFELLRRWGLGTASAIAKAVAAETTLRPTAEDVTAFAAQLETASLLRPISAEALAALRRQHAAKLDPSWTWLALKNYLFFRIPLVRPDRALQALLGRLSWVFSPVFLLLTCAAGFAGLVLAIRQWDVFAATFPYLATGEGIALGLLAIVLIKLLHELGHGLTAKRYGCRPRTAGVAVMLFVPMLYTDVTDAWRLTDRYQRLRIGAAGILTELAVACWALLLWSFLPDGALRSVVFVWATSTWVLTLLVNANPLMRFDGYYILSDALDEPNLQDTAFRLARWHMRTHLLGLRHPPPTGHDPARRRLLIAYAYATWVYRLLLFMGIALVVYLMSFKLLGIFLAVVEIGWFIIRPVAAELRFWWRSRQTVGVNPAMIRTGLIVLAALCVAFVPWRASIHGDALVGAERRTLIYAPAASQVTALPITAGMRVAEGDRLFRLSSPQLDHDAAQLRRTIDNLGWQIDTFSGQQESAARASLLVRERDTVRLQLAGLEAAIAELDLRAPFAGAVVELADPLHRLEWVERGEPLALLVDRAETLVDALVTEQDVRRIAVGAMATIRPRNPDLPAFQAKVEVIDTSALRALPDLALSSTRGGPIPARDAGQGQAVPETPVYRVRLRPDGPVGMDRMELATVRIDAEAESLAARFWRHVWGTVLRESGF